MIPRNGRGMDHWGRCNMMSVINKLLVKMCKNDRNIPAFEFLHDNGDDKHIQSSLQVIQLKVHKITHG